MEIKVRYTVVRHNGHVFHKDFTLSEIECGEFLKWFNLNFIGENDLLHRRPFTGLHDSKGNEIYEGDVLYTFYRIQNNETGEIKEMAYKDAVTFGYSEGDGYETESFHGWLLGSAPLIEYVPYNNPYWTAIEDRFEVIGSIYGEGE